MKKTRISLIKFFIGALVVLNLACLSFFVWQYQGYIFSNFVLGQHEAQIKELNNANETLGIDFFENNHLEKVELAAEELNFEKAEEIRYIRVF